MTLLPTPQSGSGPTSITHPWVLLVEDEYEDEALALRILKKYRIANQVDVVRTGEEALLLLKQRLGTPNSGRPARDSAPPLPIRSPAPEGGGQGATLLPASQAPRGQDPGQARLLERTPAGHALPYSGGSRANQGVPELILLDYGKVKHAALDFIDRLRTLPGMENIPVAVCCADQEEEKEIREAGRKRLSCLSKPFGFFKLLECIQKMDMHWFVFAEKP
jgi:CheY-like chemotaxis protein